MRAPYLGSSSQGLGSSEGNNTFPLSFVTGGHPRGQTITGSLRDQLSVGPDSMTKEKAPLHHKSPQSLRFPQQSFHTTLSYKRVTPQHAVCGKGRGQPAGNPKWEESRTERLQTPSKTNFCHLTVLPWAFPICHHQQREVVCKGTLCSCGRGPVKDSCHLAGLRIPGRDLNYQGHPQSRSERSLCHEARKATWGRQNPGALANGSPGPAALSSGLQTEHRHPESQGRIRLSNQPHWGRVPVLPPSNSETQTSYLFPLSLSLPTCEMGLIIRVNHCEDTCALTCILSPVAYSNEGSVHARHL